MFILATALDKLGVSVDFHMLVMVSLAATRVCVTIVLKHSGYLSRIIPSKAISGVKSINMPVRSAIEEEIAFQKLVTFLQAHSVWYRLPEDSLHLQHNGDMKGNIFANLYDITF